MALGVENVVSGGVGGEEFLRRTRALEALHLALSPTGRLMRILGPVVLPSPAVVQVVDAEIEGRCAVGPQIIRDQSLRNDAYFLRSLRISFNAARLSRLDWTSTSRTSPSTSTARPR
jgi:hypothetical protein